MAFNNDTKINISLKKILNKSHTDNLKLLNNEQYNTSLSLGANTIFADNIPANPNDTNLYDLTLDSITFLPVVEYVRLELEEDLTSNGHAYIAKLPSDYVTNSNNSKKGTGYFVNSQKLVNSYGKLQAIPSIFGIKYEAKPYFGGSSAKGSGTLIPPGDARDWYFDYFNGIFYQQSTIYTPPSHIECFIYVGNFLDNSLNSGNSNVLVDLLDVYSVTLPSSTPFTVDGITVQHGDTVLFTNLSTDNNRIYRANISGSSITWMPLNLYSNSSITPSNGDSIRIKSGNIFSGSLFVFDGTNFQSNDIVRFFDSTTKVNYWELSSIKLLTLVNNTVNGEVFSINYQNSENLIVNYSISRGAGNKETGQIYITTDGNNVSSSVSNTELGSCGVTFNTSISAGQLKLLYTTTNTGSDGLMKFFVQRWSDNVGGPAGLPSYPYSSGTIIATGNTGSIQIKGSDGYLSYSPDLTWDTANSGLKLGNYIVTKLLGPITLLNNQSTSVSFLTFDKNIYNRIVIEYLMTRGAHTQMGTIRLLHNGTVVSFTHDFQHTDSIPVGVTFSSNISSSNVVLYYESTDTGDDILFYYTLQAFT